MTRWRPLLGMLLVAGCAPQPYQPIGYSMPSSGYYGPRPSTLFARPGPAPRPAPAPYPDPYQAPDPATQEYETPPALLLPMEPSTADQAAPQPAIPAAAAPATRAPSGGAVPMMGFRPMHGQTPGAL